MKNILIFLAAVLHSCNIMTVNAQLLHEPEVDEQKRATFTVNAPNAREVKVISKSDSMAMGAPEYDMTRNEEGIWTVTTRPCRTGLHYYELSIDGARFSDPRSHMYFGWGKWTSCLEVPDGNIDFYHPKDVPRGEILCHWYPSKVTGTTRKCLVYTPPGYQKETRRRYPVLYLQHGAGESQLGWTMQGKVNFIMDNLIAEGQVTPMIIVMDNGYAPDPEAENPYRPRGEDNRFEDNLLQVLIPEIDSCFRTLPSAETRALAGLSMGGGQALRIGLPHPEVFGSVGTFSGGGGRRGTFDVKTSYGGVFKDTGRFNEAFSLFFIGCGTLERGYQAMKSMHETLSEHGVRNVWSGPVGSHEWQVWRHHLHDFAGHVFEPRKLAGGFAFTEGPAVDAEGNVYFSDIPNNKILKWTTDGKLETVRENSGGANGLFFDARGNLLACEGGNRRITSMDKEGNITVITGEYKRKKYNQTNDLWIHPSGGIYFTDPAYGRSEEEIEQDGMHVYYITPDRRKVIRVCECMKRPNGIIGTPDGKTLYVTDHGGGMTWKFRISQDGTLNYKTGFVRMGCDGMTMDEKENVYLTNLESNSIDVYSPEGFLVQSIKVPERPANVCFGGEDLQTLFITAQTSLYSIRMHVKGAQGQKPLP